MSPPWIIAVETSGRCGSVALAEGPRLVAERDLAAGAEHARELIACIDALCVEHGRRPPDFAHCYLSIGPGSFTGLRIAVTFARHLALATGAKLCAVPTMDVIAENCTALSDPPRHVAVMLNARRDRVFASAFEFTSDGYRRLDEPSMVDPAAWLRATPRSMFVIGEAAASHRAAIEAARAIVLPPDLWTPRASNVHRLGWRMAQRGAFTAPRDLVPCYIRRPEAEEVWEKRQGAT